MNSEKIELILGTIALVVCLIMEHVMHIGEMPMIIVSIVGYIIVAHRVVIEAIKNIIKGDLFDEETLMTVATIGAFFVGGYSEAIAVMLFFRMGEEIEGLAVGKSRSSVRSLMDLQPDTANLKQIVNVFIGAGKTLNNTKHQPKVPLDKSLSCLLISLSYLIK